MNLHTNLDLTDNTHIQKQNILILINFCLHHGKTNLMEKGKIKFRGEYRLIDDK